MAIVYICIYPSGYTLNAAELAKYGASHRYTSMSAMEAGEDINWVSETNNPYVEILAGSGANTWDGAPDTTTTTYANWTLSTTYYLTVTALPGARSEGTWDTTAYILAVAGDQCIYLGSANFYAHFEGIQCESTGAAGTQTIYPRLALISEFKNCWARSSTDAASIPFFNSMLNVGITRIWNCIAEIIVDQGDGTSIYCKNDSTYIYQSLLTGGDRGINCYAGDSQYMYNSVVFHTDDDFVNDLPVVLDYCASDDAQGTNAVDISPGGVEADEWNKAFTNYSSSDYTVKDVDSVLYDAGNDLSNAFTDLTGDADPLKYDKLGNDRSSTWDIGPFVYQTVGGSIVPIVMQQMNQFNGGQPIV